MPGSFVQVMAERRPTSPEWPPWPRSLHQPVSGLEAAEAAELAQPLSYQEPPELTSPSVTDDGDDTTFTAGVIALFVAALIAVLLAAAVFSLALLRRKRPADMQRGVTRTLKVSDGNVVVSGTIGGGKGGDAASRAGRKLRRQLDLYSNHHLFMEKYRLLGCNRSSRSRARPVPAPFSQSG